MKKIYILFLILFCIGLSSNAQTTILITMDSNGEDAYIDNFNPSGNYPDETDFCSGAWTINGTPVVWRSFMNFDLTQIPANATIVDARLSLYYNPANNFDPNGHQSLTNSDQSVLQRIISPWSEHSINWNNQPAVTTQNEVILPQSSSGFQDYTNMDVTAMVQDMISNKPAAYGFALHLSTEQYYAHLIFATGDYGDATKHPSLQITYTYPNPCINLQLAAPDEDATIDTYTPNNNYPGEIEYCAGSWTIFGTPVTWRSLFKFNLSAIPSNATIQSANLSLYFAPNNAFLDQQNSLTNSNQSKIQRITSAWSENSVTWNTQPSSSTQNEATLAQSVMATQDYTYTDVTAMVQDMITNANYGFLIKQDVEQFYGRMIFGSGDNVNPYWQPRLDICYTSPTGIPALNNTGNEVFISPNPSGGIFAVNMNENSFSKISVYDETGRI
ncbi:MAG TPA: DNRLRE domain-containing protein, partial [Bacteroidia bacterium]|nr:DNRLRE domain-containing protein [Bacteroidia bacterium]